MKNTLPTKPGVRRNSAAFGKKNTATFNGFLALFLMVMGMGISWGQVDLAAAGTYSQNFNGLSTTSATWTDNSTLSGWYTSSSSTLPISTGSDTSGNTFNIGIAGTNLLSDRAIGCSQSGSNAKRFGLRLKNNGSSDIVSYSISYIGEQWRSFSAGSLVFEYQVSSSAITSLTAGSWTANTSFNFAALKTSTGATLDGNASGNFGNVGGTLTVSVPAGSEIFLRWSRTSNSSPILAVDNISITANSASTPSLAVTGTTENGSVCSGTAATTQTYTITNTGTAASNVVVSSSDAQFVVSNLSSTSIGATNGTATYDVTFTPSSSGAKTATITVYYDTSTSATTSSLTGTGTTPVTQAVTASAASSVTAKSATLNGNYTTLGVCPATTEKGFVYSLTSANNDPLVNGTDVTKTSVTLGATGAYTLALTSLPSSSSYSYKSYVYNGTTYTYGTVQTFTTLDPLVITGTLSNGTVCPNLASSPVTYTVTNNGATTVAGVSVASSDSQFVVSAISSTTIAAAGTATYTVTFTPTTTGAKSATVTVSGTSVVSATSIPTGTGTTPVTQAVTSSTPTPISYTSATLKGTVNALGVCPSSTQKGFVYSLTSTNSDPVNAGSGVTTTSVTSLVTGAYILALTGLTAESSYTFKAYIYDGTTYTYGASTTFSTLTLTAPGAPNIGTATVSGTTASIPFTAPASNGGSTITTYTATSSPGGITSTLSQAGSGSVTVSGLTLGQAYTFTVTATNTIGTSSSSSASNSVTAAYCTSTGPSSAGTDYFTNFTASGSAGGINNTSTFSTNGYGNFTAQSVSQSIGGSVIYSAASPGIADGSSFGIFVDWNKDGDFADANESVFLSTSPQLSVNPSGNFTVPVGALLGSTRMRIVIKDATGAVNSCNSAQASSETEDYTFTVVAPTNNWTGGTGNWNTAGNWSLGAVPLSTDNITISSGSPVMDVDYTLATGRTLTISGTGGLTINPSKTLTITGTADFGGKSVTLKSDAIGTGTIGKVTGTLIGATNVTVERFIPFGKRAFRFLTPSVTTTSSIYTNWQIGGATTAGIGTHITGSTTVADGFDVTTSGNPSMFTYENNVASGTGWLAIPNTNATALTAGMGYRTLVRGDRNVDISVASTDNMNVATTLSATGTLKVGNAVFDGTTTPALNTTANTTTNGYSLIGNPYASPVDWELVTKSNVEDSYYAWDPNMGTTAERGRYVAYSASTHQATNSGTGNSSVNQFIQPGQAFFVKTIAASPSLTFKEADKASTFTNVFRTIGNSSLSVSVYNPSEVAFASPIDATIAVFATDFDASVGYGDVEKLYSSGEHLAWSRGTKLLAMDATTPVVASDELLLKTMQFSANKSYTFKVNTTNFDSSLTGYLVDQYLNSQTQLDFSTSNFITFASTTDAASYGADRFKVVFNSSALNNEEWNTKSLRIYPNPVVDNQFTIAVSPSITDKVTICIYNMIGQSVYRESATAINNSIVVHPSAILKAGVYMVEMTNNGKTSTQKIIIK